MYCTKCGAPISSDSIFCQKCGSKISDQTQQSNQGWNTANPFQPNFQNQNFNQNQYQYQNQNQSRSNGWNHPKQQMYPQKEHNPNLVCGLAYIPFLFWLPLVLEKNIPLGRKTANQGLLLLIVSIVIQIVRSILYSILSFFDWGYIFSLPFHIIGGILNVIFSIIGLGILLLVIVGIVKASRGECFELPIIGKIEIIK